MDDIFLILETRGQLFTTVAKQVTKESNCEKSLIFYLRSSRNVTDVKCKEVGRMKDKELGVGH